MGNYIGIKFVMVFKMRPICRRGDQETTHVVRTDSILSSAEFCLFVVYLMMLLRDSGCIASDDWTVVIINLKGCGKNRSWPSYRHLLRETEANQGGVIFNI